MSMSTKQWCIVAVAIVIGYIVATRTAWGTR